MEVPLIKGRNVLDAVLPVDSRIRRPDPSAPVAAQESRPGPGRARGRLPPPREEKSATDLVAKILLLNELVSLENDVFETKKKRSFSGFGSPLDRLSVGLKAKQRKAVELPKKRFGIPLDRIGVNRLSGSRG
ncbi:osteocrin [Python bivittatus]|uniref:Osteocrin n=1 Tax=Python bivittatus TaxID=176946 RepID=A0A9F5MSL4_PYTBI|nr:osteocrin [Python bivittatus]